MKINNITSPIAKLMLLNTTEFKKPSMATKERPYCIFDQEKVDVFTKNKERALPKLKKMLNKANNEAEITEGLYIADRMIDAGTKGIGDMYFDTFSRFNESKSPNVQTFLAGIYRKTLNPDAFGPLVKMLADNINNPPEDKGFDPNEEIGGAILDYTRQSFNKKY